MGRVIKILSATTNNYYAMFVERISQIRLSTNTRTHAHKQNQLTTNILKCIWTSPVHVYAYRFRWQHVYQLDQIAEYSIFEQTIFSLLVRAWVCIEFKACVHFLSSNIVCIARNKSWAWKCFNITNWLKLFHFILPYSNYPSTISFSLCVWFAAKVTIIYLN